VCSFQTNRTFLDETDSSCIESVKLDLNYLTPVFHAVRETRAISIYTLQSLKAINPKLKKATIKFVKLNSLNKTFWLKCQESPF
jgi:hypothetical protein